MATVAIPAGEVMKGITLNAEVTGMRRTRARILAGVWLMRLAARVMGVGASCVVVDLSGPED
ncbi:hypothetical protein [Novosphingobium resinovorum]|uniref:hypothetical protein n=1 Tax=Novosphingobium resinovorum TaxID=158500 RepID=UPI002ED641B9|nr:hypothetical protein [Novosphingobium resinovorum]